MPSIYQYALEQFSDLPSVKGNKQENKKHLMTAALAVSMIILIGISISLISEMVL